VGWTLTNDWWVCEVYELSNAPCRNWRKQMSIFYVIGVVVVAIVVAGYLGLHI
jgi:hypothetical protein